MTLKEYLDRRLTELEEGANTPLIEGKIMAYSEIYKRLDEFDHDVTVKEVKEICQKYRPSADCYICPLHEMYICSFFSDPQQWNIGDIEKRMKEARK